MPDHQPTLQDLAALLQKRLDVIADHSFRDRDPTAHLAALQEVSQAIAAAQQNLASDLPPRLRHFLESSSYQKALAFIQEQAP